MKISDFNADPDNLVDPARSPIYYSPYLNYYITIVGALTVMIAIYMLGDRMSIIILEAMGVAGITPIDILITKVSVALLLGLMIRVIIPSGYHIAVTMLLLSLIVPIVYVEWIVPETAEWFYSHWLVQFPAVAHALYLMMIADS